MDKTIVKHKEFKCVSTYYKLPRQFFWQKQTPSFEICILETFTLRSSLNISDMKNTQPYDFQNILA